MPDYRRVYQPGGTYFFTTVTNHRIPIFADSRANDLLMNVFHDVARKYPFETIAYCILPDHIHTIWTLPEDTADFSIRWSAIKAIFSMRYQERMGKIIPNNPSKTSKRESGIWQRRFWEHLIRNQNDLNTHIDYIHFNPIKHRLVTKLVDWKWSSFQQFVKDGYYEECWADEEIPPHLKHLGGWE